MFYKMLFDRFVDFAYLYTVLDMPRQIRIVCLYNVSVLCFVNNGLADKTSTEPGLTDIKKGRTWIAPTYLQTTLLLYIYARDKHLSTPRAIFRKKVV